MTKYLMPALALAMALPFHVQAQGQQQANYGQAFLQKFDTNKDGRVSQNEFVQPQVREFEQQMKQQFNHMDKNRNGAIECGEADAFVREMQQRMQQMHKMQQGGGQKGGQYQR